jgi:hypothetical protein
MGRSAPPSGLLGASYGWVRKGFAHTGEVIMAKDAQRALGRSSGEQWSSQEA